MAQLWTAIQLIAKSIVWQDVLDIAIVAYLIYQAIKLVRETRAAQLFKGIALLLLLFLVSNTMEMRTMKFVTENVTQVGLFAMLVVFQPELRRALEQMGRSRIGKLQMFGSGLNDQERSVSWNKFINALLEEVPSLCRQKIGALIVIERKTRLGEIIKTGTIVNAEPTGELIGNLFFPNSPLHDGAMVVRDGRLHAAGCFLPLSDNSEISRELGTRHRAALGMSEASDAIVVVVSEETGLVTVCEGGRLERGFSVERLGDLLTTALVPEKNPEPSDKPERKKGRKQ